MLNTYTKDRRPSIFNDVLAPVTQGPSSSNTAGPYRIGKLARGILKGEPEELRVIMSKKGGFYATFFNMQSDKGLFTGLLGRDILKDDMGDIYEFAAEKGLTYEIVFSDDYPALPTEMMDLTLKSEEETLSLRAISMGGGEVLINRLNGKECCINGLFEQEIEVSGPDDIRKVSTVFPLKAVPGAEPPFTTSEGMLRYAIDNKKEIWQAALDYEMSLTGLTEDDVIKVASDTLDITYRAIERGLQEGISFEGVTAAKAPGILEKIKNTELIPAGAADMGGLEALAIMEYSNSHGIIVCMPTGGAAGIIPASIRSAARSMGRTREDEIKALLTAGIIGVFYYPTHYHGSLGCQAEVGIAMSQASAALASMITKDPEAVERAAVLGMQYLLGQVCDPLEGYPQLPCFIRNIVSVYAASACANYGVLGLDTAVSLDEMVGAVMRVGESLRDKKINDMGVCACRYRLDPACSLHKDNE